MGKILLIVTIVAAILTAIVGVMNQSSLSESKARLATTEQALEQTKGNLAASKTALQESQDKLAELTTASEGAEKQLASAQADLDAAKSQVEDANKKVDEMNAEIAQLNTDLKAKDDRIAELEAAPPTPESDSSGEDTKELIAEKDTLIDKLQSDLTSARSRIDTLQEAQRNRENQVMRVGLEGRVLAVNPAWNFVVLDLGDRNGVVNNAEMLVKRGRQLIGKVRITSVEPSNSIADIVANSVPRGVDIQPGDNVIFVGDEEL